MDTTGSSLKQRHLTAPDGQMLFRGETTMAGKKFGVVVAVKVPASYHTLTEEEQAIPGNAMAKLAPKYSGKVDIVRRLWTSAFTAEVSDLFIVEADDMMDIHNFTQELTRLEAAGGDPDRFGTEVRVWAGVNPDA
jgi:hypothetical protein